MALLRMRKMQDPIARLHLDAADVVDEARVVMPVVNCGQLTSARSFLVDRAGSLRIVCARCRFGACPCASRRLALCCTARCSGDRPSEPQAERLSRCQTR
jgi:hypothetical protein